MLYWDKNKYLCLGYHRTTRTFIWKNLQFLGWLIFQGWMLHNGPEEKKKNSLHVRKYTESGIHTQQSLAVYSLFIDKENTDAWKRLLNTWTHILMCLWTHTHSTHMDARGEHSTLWILGIEVWLSSLVLGSWAVHLTIWFSSF